MILNGLVSIINQNQNIMQKFILKLPKAQLNQKQNPMLSNNSQKHYFVIKNKKILISKLVLAKSYQIRNMFHNQELDNLNKFDEKDLIINLDIYKISLKTLFAFLRIFQQQQVIIYKNQQIIQILKLSQILKIQWIIDCVTKDVVLNTHQYDCFVLLQLSQLLSICFLKKKCYEELKSLNYQQLKFNCYDLLHCDQKTFRDVLKSHYHFQIKNPRKKQSDETIIHLIQEYCKLNNTIIDPAEYISQNLFSIVQQKQGEMEVEAGEYQSFHLQQQKMSEETNIESENCEFEQYFMRTLPHKTGRILYSQVNSF